MCFLGVGVGFAPMVLSKFRMGEARGFFEVNSGRSLQAESGQSFMGITKWVVT